MTRMSYIIAIGLLFAGNVNALEYWNISGEQRPCQERMGDRLLRANGSKNIMQCLGNLDTLRETEKTRIEQAWKDVLKTNNFPQEFRNAKREDRSVTKEQVIMDLGLNDQYDQYNRDIADLETLTLNSPLTQNNPIVILVKGLLEQLNIDSQQIKFRAISHCSAGILGTSIRELDNGWRLVKEDERTRAYQHVGSNLEVWLFGDNDGYVLLAGYGRDYLDAYSPGDSIDYLWTGIEKRIYSYEPSEIAPVNVDESIEALFGGILNRYNDDRPVVNVHNEKLDGAEIKIAAKGIYRQKSQNMNPDGWIIVDETEHEINDGWAGGFIPTANRFFHPSGLYAIPQWNVSDDGVERLVSMDVYKIPAFNEL